MEVSFTRESLEAHFLNRMIRYIIPKYIPKEDSEIVRICALINEIYSVGRRFLTNRRDEREFYVQYRMIRILKREELQSLT